MPFSITQLHNIKRAFQIELKHERKHAKSINACDTCRNSGYKDMNVTCGCIGQMNTIKQSIDRS